MLQEKGKLSGGEYRLLQNFNSSSHNKPEKKELPQALLTRKLWLPQGNNDSPRSIMKVVGSWYQLMAPINPL